MVGAAFAAGESASILIVSDRSIVGPLAIAPGCNQHDDAIISPVGYQRRGCPQHV
jgi:hypothetical protein